MDLLSFIIKKIIIYIIYGYQFTISLLIGPRCRFIPTCSQYGIESINKFGIILGIFLTFKRILKCSPLNLGGEDCVPKQINNRKY